MVAKRRTVEVLPGSELARLLDDPGGLPVEIVKDGVRYELARKDNPDDYDPALARRILRETAGAWAEVDVDALIEALYRARHEGSRPMDRPKPFDGN